MSRILEYILSVISPQDYMNLGANGEDREAEEASIPQSEVVGEIARPEFKEKTRDKWRKFFFQFQNTSSSCVGYTAAKIASILYFNKYNSIVKFSPAWYYSQRNNKPSPGMFYSDIIRLSSKGAVPHELLPCERFTEDEINAIRIENLHNAVAPAFATPPNYVMVAKNFDSVASTVEKTQKGLMIWFYIHEGEWFGKEIPKAREGSRLISGHSATVVDAFTFNGIQYLLVEDSADDRNWQKLITREYFNIRGRLISYPLNFKYLLGTVKPKFNKTIVSAQECFKYEGFFPDGIPFVENWGKVTTESAKKFQAKYGLVKSGLFSKETVDKLTELYS